ncbi:MAG: SRPBCC family protein [Marmoricola sp.]|nr:SRPBCC family protein [Marmoricola sp.]
MSSVERVMHASPETVWEVLSDGWLYPLWVVGATRMRDVDRTWPGEGAQLHHSVGTWPVVIDDDTTVLESRPRELLRLEAKAWPGGSAHVALHLEAHPEGTLVRIEEDVIKGPGKLMPAVLRLPVLTWRNTETMRRLAYIVERRPHEQLRRARA